MKSLSLLALIALAGTAFAEAPIVKKKTPDKFARAAADAFTEALAADEKGDLRTALGLYEKAFAIAPHPSTAYNVGDVYRRLGDTKNAVLYFETYLAMLPNAPDHAYVEQIVDKLVHLPGTILLGTGQKSDPEAIEWKEFYILVDGEIVAKPGTVAKVEPGSSNQPVVALKVGGGSHAIDLVSSISYAHTECKVVAGMSEVCHVRAKPRVDGHLVVRASDNRIDLFLGAKKGSNDHGTSVDRIEVPPGKQRIVIRDRSFECTTTVVDVPAGTNDVAYLWVGTHEYDGLERCRTLDVKAKKLHFDE